MPSILAVSGSPSSTSRTASAADHALALLRAQGHDGSHLAVRDLPAADLLSGFRDTPALWSATDAVAQADGIVIATPVYKASYTGLLKAFLDLLPENALAGKVVLPLVTGGTIGHLLTIDYALRPVLTALGADHVVQGRFLLDSDIVRGENGGTRLTPEAERRLGDSVAAFTAALDRRAAVAAAPAQASAQTSAHASAQATSQPSAAASAASHAASPALKLVAGAAR